MRVEFHRTGERRYAVVVKRKDLPDLQMNPAPGFDPLMPHDMLHFLVEQELGLRHGIFGQIASGGTAGTFHQATPEKASTRADLRSRRKNLKRGKKMLKGNIDDCARSERATYICLHDWLSHSPDENLRERASEMKMSRESVFEIMSETERASLNPVKLAQIRARMDELSTRWSALRVDEFISLEWKIR